MNENRVVCLRQKDEIDDPLTEILRTGFRTAASASFATVSPAVIARLKGEWEDEYQRWQKRDLSARRYVYVLADGRRGWSNKPNACWY